MKMALASFAVILTGCVNPQQADYALRSRVESIDFKATATGNQRGEYGGGFGARVRFRDPRPTQVDYSKDK